MDSHITTMVGSGFSQNKPTIFGGQILEVQQNNETHLEIHQREKKDGSYNTPDKTRENLNLPVNIYFGGCQLSWTFSQRVCY